MGNSDHDTTYMRVGGDDGKLRPWHYIYVYSIESRLSARNLLLGLGRDVSNINTHTKSNRWT